MSVLATQPRLLFPATSAQAPPRYAVGFLLFLVLNATLFVRPAEIFPALLGVQIYLGLILLCLAASFPVLFEQLQPASLERRPIAVCVLGLLLAIFLSHASHARILEAIDLGWDFVKVVLYYILLVGLVTTPSRLRVFLLALVVCTTAMAALAILQYHGLITLVNLNPIKEMARDQTLGKDIQVVRLVGTGIFHDPNDFAMPVVGGMFLTLYWLTDRRLGISRLGLVIALLILGYALALTQSRGGMLAFMAGLLVFLHARFGGMLALGLAGMVLPAVLLVFGGRQTHFEAGTGTAGERVQLWSDALVLVRQAPLFGLGMDEFVKEAGLVAHNSFLHAFVELGLFGGILFVGAHVSALQGLHRLGKYRAAILDPELARMQPYLLAVVVAAIASMMSITMCYLTNTYTILGLAAAYQGMTHTYPALPPLRCDARLVLRFAQVSVTLIVVLYLFIRFVH